MCVCVCVCVYSHETSTYDRMLQKLKSYISNNLDTPWNPVACMCDFERGFMAALDAHHIDMRGCKFHLVQAVKKRLRKLDVPAESHSVVLKHLVECFHAESVEAFTASLTAMYDNANENFVRYFDSTWVGADRRTMAARWALAYQSKFQSHSPHLKGSIFAEEKKIVQEITQVGTNNISEGRNKADRAIFVSQIGDKCTLFEEVVIINSSLNTHCHKYKEHMRQGRQSEPTSTHVAHATAKRASRLL